MTYLLRPPEEYMNQEQLMDYLLQQNRNLNQILTNLGQENLGKALKTIIDEGGGGPSAATVIVATRDFSRNYKNADFIVPTGATDAQVTINLAIAALPADGGDVLLLEGVYTVDGPIGLPSNVALRGTGSGTIVKATTGIVLVKNADQVAGNTNIKVTDITIDGTGAAISCINFKKVTGSTISRCNIKGAKTGAEGTQGGILLHTCTDNVIQANILENNVYSIYCTGSKSNNIVANIAKVDSNFGIILNGSNNDNNSITSNIFSNGTLGIYCGDDNNNIVGNTCNYNKAWGIRILGDSNQIVGNNLLQNAYQYPADDDAQLYINGGNYNNIQNNTIRRGVLADGCGYGIEVSGTKNIVTNNDLYQSGYVGTIVDTGTGTVTTAGNRLT